MPISFLQEKDEGIVHAISKDLENVCETVWIISTGSVYCLKVRSI